MKAVIAACPLLKSCRTCPVVPLYGSLPPHRGIAVQALEDLIKGACFSRNPVVLGGGAGFVYSSIRLFVLLRILNRVRHFMGNVFKQCGICDFIAIFTHVKGIDSAVCLCANASGVDVEAKV